MSINDIMKYVNQTPGNTNPSVIRSMVEREIEESSKDVVKYTPQNLTEEQQAQARANIGAQPPREINLGDYGIDIAAYVISGNGMRLVSGTQKLWEEINWGGDFVFLIPFGSDVLRAFPIGCAISNGVIVSVSLDVQAVHNDIFISGGVSITGSSNHTDDTLIYNVSAITPLD